MQTDINLPKLKYCDTKLSDISGCGSLAAYKVKLASRKNESETTETVSAYRCEHHKGTGTNSKKVIELIPFDQFANIRQVNEFMRSIVGKEIVSKFHSANGLKVIYLKDNGGIMCQQPITKKWKFVYSHQITAIV